MHFLNPKNPPKFWYAPQKTITSYLLYPVSLVYQSIIKARRFAYQHGYKKITQVAAPVIVVGNISVGGTGKTPLVIYLVQLLREKGYRPGVISRGYGAKNNLQPIAVIANSNSAEVGDEPLLIARNLNCPVVICADRVQAAQKLLAENDVNIIVSDDGLQHYALHRDVEIVVIDGERGLGNGYCLPAGPLRESAKRLQKVNFVVVNNSKENKAQDFGVNVFQMQLSIDKLCNIKDRNLVKGLEELKGKQIHAVAGIGNPARFFRMLKDFGCNVIEHAFPDHHVYSNQDFAFASGDDIIVMTEKDAVKCENFATANYWYLPVHAVVEEKFISGLLSHL
jgi:tetraacyldisaccharide 4'-kinase